jgi:hypothetical protein
MEKSPAEMTLVELIAVCLSKAREGQPTRELSLVQTKLDEAMMWTQRYEQTLKDLARRAGVGTSVRHNAANGFGGVQFTDDIAQIQAEDKAHAAQAAADTSKPTE